MDKIYEVTCEIEMCSRANENIHMRKQAIFKILKKFVKENFTVTNVMLEDLSHEIWATAQLLPGEGIEDGVDRIKNILSDVPNHSHNTALDAMQRLIELVESESSTVIFCNRAINIIHKYRDTLKTLIK